jgi:hypothetical protein
LVDALYN